MSSCCLDGWLVSMRSVFVAGDYATFDAVGASSVVSSAFALQLFRHTCCCLRLCYGVMHKFRESACASSCVVQAVVM